MHSASTRRRLEAGQSDLPYLRCHRHGRLREGRGTRRAHRCCPARGGRAQALRARPRVPRGRQLRDYPDEKSALGDLRDCLLHPPDEYAGRELRPGRIRAVVRTDPLPGPLHATSAPHTVHLAAGVRETYDAKCSLAAWSRTSGRRCSHSSWRLHRSSRRPSAAASAAGHVLGREGRRTPSRAKPSPWSGISLKSNPFGGSSGDVRKYIE